MNRESDRSPRMATSTIVGLVVALVLSVGATGVGVVLSARGTADAAVPVPAAAPVPPVAPPPPVVATPRPAPSTTRAKAPASSSPATRSKTPPRKTSTIRSRADDPSGGSTGFVSGGLGNGGLDSEGRDAAGMTPGDYALQACREQTGQTNAQCIAQMERGEAN